MGAGGWRGSRPRNEDRLGKAVQEPRFFETADSRKSCGINELLINELLLFLSVKNGLHNVVSMTAADRAQVRSRG